MSIRAHAVDQNQVVTMLLHAANLPVVTARRCRWAGLVVGIVLIAGCGTDGHPRAKEIVAPTGLAQPPDDFADPSVTSSVNSAVPSMADEQAVALASQPAPNSAGNTAPTSTTDTARARPVSTSGSAGSSSTSTEPTSTVDSVPPAAPAAPRAPVSTSVPVSATSTVPTRTTVVDRGQSVRDSEQQVGLSFHSEVVDVSTTEFERRALEILTDPRGWEQAGFRFRADGSSELRVVLAEGPVVDELCWPLRTGGTVSCQNGATVAINADRWRVGVAHWDGTVETYRGYLINHEIGHLLGQRHPVPRCPKPGAPAAVMEQQTGSLNGCIGNPWPRPWEIDRARSRPVTYAPLPDWAPPPVPSNLER